MDNEPTYPFKRSSTQPPLASGNDYFSPRPRSTSETRDTQRPNTFMRRPTNLSEKAARKANTRGEEPGLNDSLNLEGGLDIVLNCEVSQRDPAGITTAYRLLVPALWYDGNLQDLTPPEALKAKRGLLSRFGTLKGRERRNSGGVAARRQGEGYYGREEESGSDTGSQSGSGSESGSEFIDEKPQRLASFRRRLSVFGRKKQYDSEEDEGQYSVRDRGPYGQQGARPGADRDGQYDAGVGAGGRRPPQGQAIQRDYPPAQQPPQGQAIQRDYPPPQQPQQGGSSYGQAPTRNRMNGAGEYGQGRPQQQHQQHQPQQRQQQQQQQWPQRQNSLNGGYNGIEAYKEPGKKARKWF